jgi:hypothetical protein
VLLARQGGSLAAPLCFPVGRFSFPTDVAIADFNHDGVPDIATINGNTNDVSVLLQVR